MNRFAARSMPAVSSDERVGLAVAAGLHVLLLAWLAWKPVSVALPPPPERMTVTLTQSVGLTSTSPDPAAEAAPDNAPQLGEPAPRVTSAPKAVTDVAPKSAPKSLHEPAPAKPSPVVKVEPNPQPIPLPKPTASPVAKPAPAPRAAPQPTPRPTIPAPSAPARRPTPVPSSKPVPTPAPRLAPAPAARPASVPAPAPAQARPATPASRIGNDFLKGVPAPSAGRQAVRPAATPGGSRLGDDFLKGVPGSQSSGSAATPRAAAIGPAVQSALAGSISRQLKPHWIVPQGADAEKLVTILSWSLNRDGSLAGSPQVVRQEGVTDANRAQAARHAEQAIRAVQLAAPFNLPAEYFDAWKRVASFRFDRKLSQ